ncbi:hypothetical protein NPIL_648691 [Nephila pilipes]|uniref:Uncharacterized protein n=1 Tax=Nephila pilipes TaxID=299642 RepID=A0A8X6Q7K0_NEPPI|nr:hypothetical protein NPIL_648691 [Nephila pilipes]
MARTKKTDRLDTNIMAGTKQTARKKKENIESIPNEDPTDLEIDTDGEESETIDTTEQDRNEVDYLLRTRMEENSRKLPLCTKKP